MFTIKVRDDLEKKLPRLKEKLEDERLDEYLDKRDFHYCTHKKLETVF